MIGKAHGRHTAVRITSFAFALLLAACWTPAGSAKTYDVTEYGAVGDGRTLDTAAINQTIETAAANVPVFMLKSVEDFSIHMCDGLPDTRLDKAEDRKF